MEVDICMHDDRKEGFQHQDIQQQNGVLEQNGGLETSERFESNDKDRGEENCAHEEEKKDARKKHRRGNKRNKPRKPRQRYKPFNKLTWDEKRLLDEKDAEKALRRREELVLQKGRPIAPYNTTQFLMQEHDPVDQPEHNHVTVGDVSDGEGSSGSSSSSDEYFVKDFDEFYDRIHIDTLNSYTKEDLIKNVFELEQRVSELEREKLKLLQDNKKLKEEKDKH